MRTAADSKCFAGWIQLGPADAVPPDNTVPSASVTFLNRPYAPPFLTGITSTVIASPGLNDALLQPLCAIAGGPPASIVHCRTLPVSSFTSIVKRQWGFAQNHSTTVPLRVS